MNIVKEQVENALVLVVQGRIDSSTAPELQAELMASMTSAPIILLDLAQTDYLSSAGLRVILMGAKACKKDQRSFGLCRARESVHEVLEISGFLSIVSAFASRADALAQLAP